ncbi:R3H domain-containing nucleic acid-binding protein [Pseudobacteriovorax antillogorgiicola]|uniref:R3H domain-containing protein n=1 Tax=Pseudobacteriovorax antillogorgiicola TaxID=1513793 RepID=A0A1Y6BAB8_9BACT|nr:R3H domain-containing nucleic acid-binding protein [Pseudobacteriovorax antillogorgiicola]TCS59254.1 R3H domain-containing protein [Pseudobacteriovorax antillogorgiicola]SME90003.1 R3H domain-containing protein [Pseudobacteriovorax antillogorgiicola]
MGSERWPALVEYFEGETGKLANLGTLEEQMQACLKWYTETFNYLITENTLNLSNINGIIPGVVFIGLDLRTLVANDNTHEVLVYNEARPNHELWNLIEKVLKKSIPGFSKQTLAYLQWAYGEKEEKTWEIGSRPPIGKYAPSFRNRARTGANRDRNERGGNQGGNRKGNSRGNQKRGQGGGDRRGSSEQKEKSALLDVNNAVKKLKKDPNLNEVKLSPTNSFYRRLQHKHAISQGFESISSGEGNDRSVVVKRGKDEANEA